MPGRETRSYFRTPKRRPVGRAGRTTPGYRRGKEPQRDAITAVLIVQCVLCGIVLVAAFAMKTAGGSLYDSTRETYARYVSEEGALGFGEAIATLGLSVDDLRSALFGESAKDPGTSGEPQEPQMPEGTGEEPTLPVSAPVETQAQSTDPAEGPGDAQETEETEEPEDEAEGSGGGMAAPANASFGTLLLDTGLSIPIAGRYTSQFGYREHPITDEADFHDGVDIAAASGTVIPAPGAATVLRTGETKVSGKYIMLDHGDGVVTFYGHLSKISVKEGKKVKAGQTIGLVGSTGMSTGPHLHFSLMVNGVYFDPVKNLEGHAS